MKRYLTPPTNMTNNVTVLYPQCQSQPCQCQANTKTGLSAFMMDPSSKDFKLQLGDLVGGYILCEDLGKGAFGVVYAARQAAATDPPTVAIKVLRGALGHSNDQYEEEVAALKKVTQAGQGAAVVRLVEHFVDAQHGGCYCIVTEPLCYGGNLETLIDGGQVYELQAAMRWMREMAETMLVLHTSFNVRLFHGDLNPRNVLLRRGDQGQLEAYVADVGVALRNHPYGMNDADRRKCNSMSIAPEMLTGEGKFNATSEVWSWGVLAYALLSRSLARCDAKTAWSEEQNRAFFLSVSTEGVEGAWAHELESKWATQGQAGGISTAPRALLELIAWSCSEAGQRASMRMVVREMRELVGRSQDKDGEAKGEGQGSVWSAEEAELLRCEDVLRKLMIEAKGTEGQASEALVRALLDRAVAHEKLEEHSEAEMCLTAARTHAEKMTHATALQATCADSLGQFHHRKGNYLRAAPLFDEALALRRAALPNGHPDIAMSLENRATLHMAQGQHDQALGLYEEALDLWRAALPSRPLEVAQTLNNLANLCNVKGDYDRALQLYEETLALRRTALPAGQLEYARTLSNLAVLLANKGELDQAVPLCEEALELMRVGLRKGHPQIAQILNCLANLWLEKGDNDKALPLYEEALAIKRTALPVGHPAIATSIHNIAILYAKRGEYDRALAHYEEALEMRRTALPQGHPLIAASISAIGDLYRGKGEYDQALAWYVKALALRRAALPLHHPDVHSSTCALAEVYEGLGRHEQAAAVRGGGAPSLTQP